jgi:hypothetical protein
MGTANFITLPGYGHILGYAGHLVVIYDFETQIYSFEKWVGTGEPLDWEPLCDYLAS